MTNQTTNQKNFYFIPLAIIIAGVIIAGAIVYTRTPQQISPKSEPAQGVPPEEEESAKAEFTITEKDHVRGNFSAPVTIIEFSDLECPFCQRFHPTMQQILADYPDKVRWVYKHFPLDQIHSKARKEAQATECANELGGNDKFWAYVDRLFEITPANDRLDLSLLPQIAEEVGLNRPKFEECLQGDMQGGKYADHIEDDYQEGIAKGVTGTPGNFVNGEPISGAVPYETLKAAVEKALAELQ